MSGVLGFAKKLSTLSAGDFKLAVAFAKELAGRGGAKGTPAKKGKRKYTRRAKAVEVAPGVKVRKGGGKVALDQTFPKSEV